MRLFQTLDYVSGDFHNASIAIGNFDGLHLGHQVILNEARLDAKKRNAMTGLLTFEPHPRRYFNPQTEPFRLTLLKDKMRILDHGEWDSLIALPFDKTLAATSASDFVFDLLISKLKAGSLFIGADFHFGAKREGTPALLQELAAKANLIVNIVPQLKDRKGIPFSSTYIREALKAGDLVSAKSQLGRDWSLSGIVIKGDQRGRQIGFPTANIALGEYLVPAMGVYAIRTEWEGKWMNGVANIGRRPTIGGSYPQLEIHVFDFDGDLYGQELVVNLMDFIRPERKFPGLKELKQQITEDGIKARSLLKTHNLAE